MGWCKNNGKPGYSQSQGSVERAIRNIKDLLKTHWVGGLQLAQAMTIRTYDVSSGSHKKVQLEITNLPDED